MSLSLLDRGQHLGTGFHAGLSADPLLDEGKHPLDKELAEVPTLQDLGYRGIGGLLGECYEPAPVELNTDDIWLKLFDSGPDILDTLL